MKVKCWFLLVFFTLHAAATAQEALTETKKADIAQLLEVTGAAKVTQQFVDLILGNFMDAIRKAQPSLPARGFAIIEEETRAVLKEELANELP